MAVASFAIGSAQAIAGYQGQVANYKQSQRLYDQNARNTNEALAQSYAQSQFKMQQSRAEATNKLTENSLDALRARSTANAAAGEAGVVGLSVDRLMQDYHAREGRYTDNVTQNLEWEYASAKAGMESARAGAQNQINSMPIPQRPSFADAGLRIAASAANAGSIYMKKGG